MPDNLPILKAASMRFLERGEVYLQPRCSALAGSKRHPVAGGTNTVCRARRLGWN